MTKLEALQIVATREGYDNIEVMLNIKKDTLHWINLLDAMEEYGDSRYQDGQDNSGDGRAYHYGGM